MITTKTLVLTMLIVTLIVMELPTKPDVQLATLKAENAKLRAELAEKDLVSGSHYKFVLDGEILEVVNVTSRNNVSPVFELRYRNGERLATILTGEEARWAATHPR